MPHRPPLDAAAEAAPGPQQGAGVADPCLAGCVASTVLLHQPSLAAPLPASCSYKKHAGLDCYPPLQIMFASKTTNRGKLDSHCWFFDGFAYLLQPDFCVLFDAGRSDGQAWAARQACRMT